MSGPELENLFHLGHARKHRERIDIDNAIYAHFGVLSGQVTKQPLRSEPLELNRSRASFIQRQDGGLSIWPNLPSSCCRHRRDCGSGEPELRHVRVHRQWQAVVGCPVWHGEPTLHGKRATGTCADLLVDLGYVWCTALGKDQCRSIGLRGRVFYWSRRPTQ